VNSQETPDEQSAERTFEETDTMVWIASILEIRAMNPWNVLVRIKWFYRPDDLPNGRQPYHGTNEIINSHQQDIIDVQTVAGRANIIHWNENDDMQDANGIKSLFWRQIYNHITDKLSVSTSTVIALIEIDNKVALYVWTALQSRYGHVLV
jgi:hypothetical protein